jgi:hypothetical protein
MLELPEIPAVTLSELTKADLRLLRLALNRIGEDASRDLDALKLEFGESLQISNKIDLSISGFEMGEIDVVLGDVISGSLVLAGPGYTIRWRSRRASLAPQFAEGFGVPIGRVTRDDLRSSLGRHSSQLVHGGAHVVVRAQLAVGLIEPAIDRSACGIGLNAIEASRAKFLCAFAIRLNEARGDRTMDSRANRCRIGDLGYLDRAPEDIGHDLHQ